MLARQHERLSCTLPSLTDPEINHRGLCSREILMKCFSRYIEWNLVDLGCRTSCTGAYAQ